MAKKKALGIAAGLARSEAGRLATGGRRCDTCTFQRREELEAECAAWNQLRETGKTRAGWKLLHEALRRELGYPTRRCQTLIDHLEKCLGWTLS